MVLTNPTLVTGSYASTSGTFTAANQIVVDSAAFPGVLNGAAKTQDALARMDGTGIGAAIFSFTGAYSATNANISEWFGNRQLVRMRCTDSGTGPGVSGAVRFDLPGTLALTTAFDALVTAGLPETLTFIIEYTGPADDFLQIFPRISPAPQITGTTSVIVRTGTAATIEVTRTSGTISNFVLRAQGSVGDAGALNADTFKFINPAVANWDASASGPLPTTNVVKGNAYIVVNAPSDGSGRFGEVMVDDDWVVWTGETFTAWATEPHQWAVLPAHEVRRISALASNFLTGVQTSPVSDRNTLVRGANYADSVGEIRMKLYTQRSDYSAADLNTTGDIDEYHDSSDGNGFLGIRLQGSEASLATILPTLYVYSEDGSGNFTQLLNLQDDFTNQGNFGAETDYLADRAIAYNANDTWRIYVTTLLPRYTAPAFDVSEDMLLPAVQAKLNRTDPTGADLTARVTALEGKVNPLYPLTSYVSDLEHWGDIYNPALAASTVDLTTGYTLVADYRGDGTRYESPGVSYSTAGSNVVDYTGLGDNNFRTFGVKIPQTENITLTGTSGTANIDVAGTNYLATFNTDLTTTASDFVSSHSAALGTANITVTAAAGVLTFTNQAAINSFTIAAPVNATGDLAGTLASGIANQTLLSIVDGAEIIPFLRTVAGNYQVNNYTPSTTENTRINNETHYITTITGQTTLRAGTTDTATFTVTPFPAAARNPSRTVQIGLDVLLNGVDVEAEHLAGPDDGITIPADNAAQAYENIDESIFLGPVHNNRTVDVTIRYRTRVSGSDLLVDVQLVTAPSDVTIRIQDVFVFLSYDADAAVARVDNFLTLQDLGGNYSFTGQNELLFTFHPFVDQGFANVVPVAVDSTGTFDQLNDTNVPIPAHSFESMQIPDQTALPNFEFRTFAPDHYLLHRDLQTLLGRRTTQWCYGLALLRAITENAVTERVDFTQSIVLIGATNGTRVALTVDDSDTNNIKLGLIEV